MYFWTKMNKNIIIECIWSVLFVYKTWISYFIIIRNIRVHSCPQRYDCAYLSSWLKNHDMSCMTMTVASMALSSAFRYCAKVTKTLLNVSVVIIAFAGCQNMFTLTVVPIRPNPPLFLVWCILNDLSYCVFDFDLSAITSVGYFAGINIRGIEKGANYGRNLRWV